MRKDNSYIGSTPDQDLALTVIGIRREAAKKDLF